MRFAERCVTRRRISATPGVFVELEHLVLSQRINQTPVPTIDYRRIVRTSRTQCDFRISGSKQ